MGQPLPQTWACSITYQTTPERPVLSCQSTIRRAVTHVSGGRMLDKLKADFDGIIELVNKAPAPLQETAFKMILEQWFVANTAPKAVPHPTAPPPPFPGAPAATAGVPDAIKPFLTANAITTETIEKVFHPTGPGAQ